MPLPAEADSAPPGISLGNTQEERIAAGIDETTRHHLTHGTARLVAMMAITEPAARQVRAELDKSLFDRTTAQVMQAKFLQTGAIDEAAGGSATRQVITPGVGGRVLAGSTEPCPASQGRSTSAPVTRAATSMTG